MHNCKGKECLKEKLDIPSHYNVQSAFTKTNVDVRLALDKDINGMKSSQQMIRF